MDFKNIHIGQLIKQRATELEMDIYSICKFLNTSEDEIEKMYTLKSVDSERLLRCCKLLDYDFFRIFSQHLILYSPVLPVQKQLKPVSKPLKFRKHIYTKDMIEFILTTIESGEKTKTQVVEEYRIPKTTLYKWISKYKP